MDTPTLVAALGFLAFTGWNLYLTSRFQAQKEANVELTASSNARFAALSARIEENRKDGDHRWETVLKDYASKAEVSGHMERIEKALEIVNAKLDEMAKGR